MPAKELKNTDLTLNVKLFFYLKFFVVLMTQKNKLLTL